MLRYRTFHNSDPPALVTLWRSRSRQPGWVQPLSVDVLEQYVLGRLYFDYGGLLLAWDDDRPLGFAHAGFGPNEAEDQISTELGVVSLVVVRPDCDEAVVAAGLLERSEQYLARRGAKVIYGGGIRPLNPFYLGLYGGAELPGVLETDAFALRLFNAHGYREIDHVRIFRADLHQFRAPVDRRQMQIRRQMLVEATADPPTRTWWEASTTCHLDLTRFDLVLRGGGSVGHATIRAMEAGALSTPVCTVGLLELEIDRRHRRQGLATFLLTEVFHQLARQAVSQVEVQTMEHNTAAMGLYAKLGLRQINRGVVFRKDSAGPR